MHQFSALVFAAASLTLLASPVHAERGAVKTISGNAPTPTGAWSDPRDASHTLPAFDLTVPSSIQSRQLTGIPAGTYTSYTVSFDWGGSTGGAWSGEALWAFADAPYDTANVYYADPGPAPNSARNSTPRPISWSGFFTQPYTVPASGDLYFLYNQQFLNSSASWSNVAITLGDATSPSAVASQLGGSTSAPIGSNQVLWFSFTYGGSGAFSLDTAGSILTPNRFGDPNDTEMALYSATGSLIKENDDAPGLLTSQLDFTDGELAAGTYYLAVGGFDVNFGTTVWNAAPFGAQTGTIIVNGLSIVPEPTALFAIALAGAAFRRRR